MESTPIKPPISSADPLADPSEAAVKAYAGQVKLFREKILFGLAIYPALSPTMLHTFIGPANSVTIWKEIVLAELIAEGLVVQEEISLTSPHDRIQTYTVLHLASNPYTAPIDSAADQTTPDSQTTSPVA